MDDAIEILVTVFEFCSNCNSKVTIDEMTDTYISLYCTCGWGIKIAVSKNEVRKCGYCGNSFIPKVYNSKYCNNIAKGEIRSCREIGASRVYRDKVKNDYIFSIYKKAYTTHHARIRNNKMTNEQFRVWCNHAKDMMYETIEGTISIDDFEKWLKK